MIDAPENPEDIKAAVERGKALQARAEEVGYVGWDSAAIAGAYAFPLTGLQYVEGVAERCTAVGLRDPDGGKIFVLSTLN